MEWIVANWPVLVAVLLGVSEALTLIPSIKSNGIFQLIFNVLKSIKDKIVTPPAA
jgi:hypothetical protein